MSKEDAQVNVMHDFRQGYYRVLEKVLDSLSVAQIQGDLNQWLRSLLRIYTHTGVFYTDEERKSCEKELTAAKTATRNVRHVSIRDRALTQAAVRARDEAEDKLQTVSMLLHECMKEHNMLLPQQAADDSEFNVDEAYRMSDV